MSEFFGWYSAHRALERLKEEPSEEVKEAIWEDLRIFFLEEFEKVNTRQDWLNFFYQLRKVGMTTETDIKEENFFDFIRKVSGN